MNHLRKDSKICCFFGDVMIKKISHCYKLLLALIDEMIAKKYRRFLLANDSEFGAMAIEVFEIFKDKYSQIERVLVQSEKFYDLYYVKYFERYFDSLLFKKRKLTTFEQYKKMIDKSSICVVYFDENAPSTDIKKAVQYAKEHGKKVLNLHFK